MTARCGAVALIGTGVAACTAVCVTAGLAAVAEKDWESIVTVEVRFRGRSEGLGVDGGSWGAPVTISLCLCVGDFDALAVWVLRPIATYDVIVFVTMAGIGILGALVGGGGGSGDGRTGSDTWQKSEGVKLVDGNPGSKAGTAVGNA